MSAGLRREAEKAWRLATAPLRCLPDFIIPGAPKCGSSTLYNCVALHPRVRRSSRKEPTNFIDHPHSELRSRMHFPLRVGHGGPRRFLTGEASVNYFLHPDAPRTIRRFVPGARLIFILRDPVARAWSDFQMCVDNGIEPEPFKVVIRRSLAWVRDASLDPLLEACSRTAASPVRYITTGLYARQLARWFEVFPREQCLVVIAEDFFADPASITRRVWHHLDLEDAPLHDVPSGRIGKYSTGMPADLEHELRAFFAPENARLAELLGQRVAW